MKLTDAQYDQLVNSKEVIINGRKIIRKIYTIKSKNKPDIKGKCVSWFSDACFKSSIILVE